MTMKRLSIAFVFATMVSAAGVATSGAQDPQDDHGRPEPPDAKVHHARGEARPGGGGGSPLLTYHGGPVMTTGAYVEPIFWGTSWDPSLASEKQTGLRTFYSGMSGATYDATNSEYTQTGGGHGGLSVTLG